jgi:hypothetical protein
LSFLLAASSADAGGSLGKNWKNLPRTNAANGEISAQSRGETSKNPLGTGVAYLSIAVKRPMERVTTK